MCSVIRPIKLYSAQKKVGREYAYPTATVRDLTRDGRWRTYDVSVLKLSNVSFRGKCARMETLKRYHHQQNSPGWVIFLQLARRASVLLCICLFSENTGAGDIPYKCRMKENFKKYHTVLTLLIQKLTQASFQHAFGIRFGQFVAHNRWRMHIFTRIMIKFEKRICVSALYPQ
jgi:hypothetical protein